MNVSWLPLYEHGWKFWLAGDREYLCVVVTALMELAGLSLDELVAAEEEREQQFA